jgi:hypothetical protein
MRQGSDQPFSVTTGWNGRPFGGAGGGTGDIAVIANAAAQQADP